MTSIGWLITPEQQLSLVDRKQNMITLLRAGEAIWEKVVEEWNAIDDGKLFRFELHPDSGEPFRSMSEYAPFLIQELKDQAHLHKLSLRQLQNWLRLDKLFVKQLGISADQIMRDGISIYTELAEAMDYNHKTGVVSDTPREGKLGKEQALALLAEFRESGTPLSDVKKTLDEERGVKRRWLELSWERNYNDTYSLRAPVVHDGDVTYDLVAGVPLDIVEWFSTRAGALCVRGDWQTNV